MENVIKIAGISLLGTFGAILLKDKNKGIAVFCAICASFTVILFGLRGGIGESAAALLSLFQEGELYGYATVLMRALGIAYIASLTSSLCREAGETIIGGAVELFAKGELIALSMPLVGELMELAGEMV